MKKAIIFDMDGVIVDSEVAWHDLEYQHYSRKIEGWTLDDHRYLTGMSQKDSYPMLQERFGLTDSWEEHLAFYDQAAELVYRERCGIMPGFLPLVNGLVEQNVPTGLASSSPRYWIKMVFERFPVSRFFRCAVSSEDVGRKGKPAPDVYLEAVRRLGLEPGDCVAIEDSLNGILSARKAGLFTIGFRTEHNTSTDFPELDLEIEGFTEENRKKVLGLVV